MERLQQAARSPGGGKACQWRSCTSLERSRSACESGSGRHVGVVRRRQDPRSGWRSRRKVATMKSWSPGPG
eukprot:4762824-Alexandrium_andersonii.AAC.1